MDHARRKLYGFAFPLRQSREPICTNITWTSDRGPNPDFDRAGAEVVMAPHDTFRSHRHGQLKGWFGVNESINK